MMQTLHLKMLKMTLHLRVHGRTGRTYIRFFIRLDKVFSLLYNLSYKV